jgi:acetylglutamate kinase
VPEPDSPFGELIRNQEMREKLTVIKVGGKIVEEEATLRQLLNDFAAIDGHKVLVHGGGRSATKIAAQLGIESKMVNGRRITDAETLKVVTMVYGGLVNKNRSASTRSQCTRIDRSGYECNPFGETSGERSRLRVCGGCGTGGCHFIVGFDT